MRIDQDKTKNKYNELEEIWNSKDKWHLHTHNMISVFIESTIQKYPLIKESKILNAGSAGNSYSLDERNILHIDIADKKLKHLENSLIASIESIPLPSEAFDTIICVGSVINYCDPIVAIQELSRVLKKGGKMILEFENSNTLELWGTKRFNQKAILVNTFYEGEEIIWFFSEKFIEEILSINNLKVLSSDHCHIISPLIYRMTKNIHVSARFCKLDKIFKHLPLFKTVASNTIILAEKTI